MPNRESQGGGSGGGGQQPSPRRGLLARNPFLIIVMVVAGLFMVTLWFKDGPTGEMKYGTFWSYLNGMPTVNPLPPKDVAAKDGSVRTPPNLRDPEPFGTVLKVDIRPTEIIADIKPFLEDAKKNHWRVVKGVVRCRVEAREDRTNELKDLLYTRGIPFSYETPLNWQMALLWGMPVLFFIFIFMMMFRSSRVQGENVLSFGRSRAKVVGEDKTGVSFDDVAGADEPKEELEEIVEFLKEPERFTALGGKIPKGCLLVGPPGCGKTLLARAVAGEAEVPFFSISGSDFVEMFVGVGAARVRDLFNTAKQKAPCIVFVDEIDAVGRHRGTGLGGGHDEREQTLNQLLVEMDGFDGRKGVIILAATNRPDILDPALLRPGRFDRNVSLDPPDLRGRDQILKIHARDKPLEDNVDLMEVARRTPGFSGADLANVMNEGALLAARRHKTTIGMSEVTEAIERVIAGPERRSRRIGEKEKEILAYHELGHALVSRYSKDAHRVRKISIIPRGKGALGYTLTVPEEERFIITKDELLTRIRVLLGGRSAEEIVFAGGCPKPWGRSPMKRHRGVPSSAETCKLTKLSRPRRLPRSIATCGTSWIVATPRLGRSSRTTAPSWMFWPSCS